MNTSINTKRIYEDASLEDGTRVLVDRLWPRGISKERAHLSAWMKEVAPSNDLRRWYSHQPERFEGFSQRYRQELDTDPAKQQALQQLGEFAKNGKLTLLYGAKTPQNEAVVLQGYLQSHLNS